MADSWKPDYIDLDSGAWLASRTRRKLKDPRMWGIYWELIHLLNEAGGSMELDREDLLETTLATPEELDRVLAIDHFDQSDGVLTHRVVTEKIDRIRARLGKSSEGGKRSGEARRAKAEARRRAESGTHFEPPSEPVPKGGGSKGLTDLGTEGLTEGLTRAREADAPGPSRSAPNSPGQVKTGAQRASDQNPGAKPGLPVPLEPERLKLLIDGCRSTSAQDRDMSRPWLSKKTGEWFNRQMLSHQIQFEKAFTERFGFGIDTGPPAGGTAAAPANGAGVHSKVAVGAPVRAEAPPAARETRDESGGG